MRYHPLLTLAALVLAGSALAAPSVPGDGHYLFAWAGDAAGQGEDFIAVIDADPGSAHYGELLAAAASGIPSHQVHHTEYWMPQSGFLFANDHQAGETVVFDLTDPLRPQVRARFHSLAGFSHPHSFLRLPNGHVLASFQFEGAFEHGTEAHAGAADPAVGRGAHGGIVEIDEDGHAIRSASTADAGHADEPLMAYSLLPLPDIDRVLVTNSGMRYVDPLGHTYQLFRLSDLKLLSTNALDRGAGSYGEVNPEEARRGPDGAVYIQTMACGVERITGLTGARPLARLVYKFPGTMCGVPSLVGHYWIQSVQILHALVVIDLTATGGPKEVARVVLDGQILPHWTGYDARTHRIAVSGSGEARIFMLSFDPDSGALQLDAGFHDRDGRPGFDTGARTWPHGWTGSAVVHGMVFSN
ncbi:MAG: hypothetical protein JO005_00685 [Gammaproteobacteria bacterium]|nr:hypothetical protein [Gammaproteobacteria bacterium]